MACKISLMEWQEGPVFSTARFMGLFAGRRAGKTDAIKARMKLKLQKPGFRYTYISPLSGQGEQVWREMIADASWRPRILTAARRPYPHFFMRNKAALWFRSMQRPEGIRSTGEDEICADESQDSTMTENAIDTVILPMLADRRGSLLISGQFRGEDYRYARFWIPGQREIDGKPNPKYNPAFESWRFPTSVGFCFQGESGQAELDLQKSVTRTAVWEQEWECLPRANANAVFTAAKIDAISINRRPLIKREETPKRSGAYIAAVDIGGIQDQEKLTVTHQSGDIVFAKAFPLGRDAEENARDAMEVANTFRSGVVIDTTGELSRARGAAKDNRVEKHRAWADRFRLDFRTFTFQGLNKERLIENTRLAVQDGIIGIFTEREGKDVCDEMKAYEYTYNKNTHHYTYQGPDGKKDDYVQCIAMTVEALNRGWVRNGNGGNLGSFLS